MKFQHTRFWKNYKHYDKIIANSSMRSTIDGLLYWRLLNAFNFETFLEIGIYQGQTTGLFFESSKNAHVTAVDPEYNLDLLYRYYPEALTNLNFINSRSQDVQFTESYDFILIDGDHSYKSAWKDIENCLPLLKKHSVLALDDYKTPGVAKAIEQLYNTKHNLVPFMRCEQTEFWHDRSMDRGDFLDSLLDDPLSKFIFVENTVDQHNNTVLKCKTVAMLTDQIDYFDLALKHYKI